MSTPIITTTNAHVPLPIKTLQPAHINELPVGAQGFYSAGNITLQQNASNQNDFVHAASGGRRRRKRQNKRGGYINANLIPSSPLAQNIQAQQQLQSTQLQTNYINQNNNLDSQGEWNQPKTIGGKRQSHKKSHKRNHRKSHRKSHKRSHKKSHKRSHKR